jgi:hypothetical protein
MTFEKPSVWKGYKVISITEYGNVTIEQDKYGGAWVVYKHQRDLHKKEAVFQGNLRACKSHLIEKEEVQRCVK